MTTLHYQDFEARCISAEIVIQDLLDKYFTHSEALSLLHQIWQEVDIPFISKPLDDLEKAVNDLKKETSHSELSQFSKTLLDEISREINLEPNYRRNDQHYPVVYIETKKWLIAKEWLIKLAWDSKYKINQPKPVRDAYKPEGVLLAQYFRLCKECHASQDAVNLHIPYRHGAHWLRTVFVELRMEGILSVYYQKPLKVYNGNIKDALLAEERQKLSNLKLNQNPYNDSPWRARSILFDAAIDLSQQSDRFHLDYWQPFLKAYTSYASSLKKGSTYFQKNGKVYQRTGKGKGLILIGTTSDFKHLCAGIL